MTPVRAPVTASRAAVVGTGLIGGSILKRLHAAGLEVRAWDPDPATRKLGTAQGLGFEEKLAGAVRDADVVFLAGPLIHLPRTLAEVVTAAPSTALLTDVGSTKLDVWRAATSQHLTDRFIPGHPMAGAERAGLASADPDLFTGASWVLCPPGRGPLDGFRALTELIVTVFGAHVVPMSPDVHDTVAALASHIPHLLAGGLAGAVARSPLRDAVLNLAAGSFRDGTRVAGTPYQRTADMLTANREPVLRQLELVQDRLAELIGALREGDGPRLAAQYAEARQLRQALQDRPMTEESVSFPVMAGDADADVAADPGADADAAAAARADVVARADAGADPGAGADAERAFLLDLGDNGGCLIACAVHHGRVTYRIRRPAAR